MLFGDDGELFFSSEIVSEGTGGDRGNGNNEKCEGENVDLQCGGDSQEGSVQVAADGMGDSVEVHCPLGSGELSVSVFYGMVDEEVSDGGSDGKNIVGDVCRNSDPDAVEGARLKSFSLDADLILCSDIPHIGINYKKVKQNRESTDTCYDSVTFRKLRNGEEEQAEYGQCKLVHE